MSVVTSDSEIELITDISDAVSSAINDLPILTRLEFAKTLVCENGGSKDGVPMDPILVIATEVLESVIEVLRKHPRAAKLGALEP